MDEMYEIAQQAKSCFLGSMKCTKLVMNEMYEIYREIAQIAAWFSCLCCRFIAKFEYEYSRICVASVERA